MNLVVAGNEFQATEVATGFQISGSGILPFIVEKIETARWMLAETMKAMGWERTVKTVTVSTPQGKPTDEKLIEVCQRFRNEDECEAAGFVFDGELKAKVGDTGVVYSRGAWRVGIVTKVGRTNITIEYTTDSSIKEARDPRFASVYAERGLKCWRSTKSDKFANVGIWQRNI